VLGLDPRRDGAELRQRVGVQLQERQLPDELKVAEALELYGFLYRLSGFRTLEEALDHVRSLYPYQPIPPKAPQYLLRELFPAEDA
jgi:ABC-type multidrug transport system ATPase subunit